MSIKLPSTNRQVLSLLLNPHINWLYRLLSFKQHLFNRIGSNTKDHQDANGLNEIDVGGSEVVHVLFLALANHVSIRDVED